MLIRIKEADQTQKGTDLLTKDKRAYACGVMPAQTPPVASSARTEWPNFVMTGNEKERT